jgi:hypothetical protein
MNFCCIDSDGRQPFWQNPVVLPTGQLGSQTWDSARDPKYWASLVPRDLPGVVFERSCRQTSALLGMVECFFRQSQFVFSVCICRRDTAGVE